MILRLSFELVPTWMLGIHRPINRNGSLYMEKPIVRITCIHLISKWVVDLYMEMGTYYTVLNWALGL